MGFTKCCLKLSVCKFWYWLPPFLIFVLLYMVQLNNQSFTCIMPCLFIFLFVVECRYPTQKDIEKWSVSFKLCQLIISYQTETFNISNSIRTKFLRYLFVYLGSVRLPWFALEPLFSLNLFSRRSWTSCKI